MLKAARARVSHAAGSHRRFHAWPERCRKLCPLAAREHTPTFSSPWPVWASERIAKLESSADAYELRPAMCEASRRRLHAGTCNGRAVQSPNRLALCNIAGSSFRSQARGDRSPRVEADSRRPCRRMRRGARRFEVPLERSVRHRQSIGGAVLSCAMSLTRGCGPGRLWTARAGRDVCRASSLRGHEGTPAVLSVSIVACRSHEAPRTLHAALRAGFTLYRAIRSAP